MGEGGGALSAVKVLLLWGLLWRCSLRWDAGGGAVPSGLKYGEACTQACGMMRARVACGLHACMEAVQLIQQALVPGWLGCC